MMKRYVLLFLVALIFTQSTAAQEGQILTGTLNPENQTVEFTTRLQAGDVLTVVGSSDVDTVLLLSDGENNLIAANDDANRDTLDSALAVRIPRDDRYTLVVSANDSQIATGTFNLRLSIGDDSLLPPMERIMRVTLSGPEQIHETTHFRLHYTVEGRDAVSSDLVDEVASIIEETRTIIVDQMGWSPPPPDMLGGDERYDVYLARLPGPDGFNQGLVRTEAFIGDNPYTAHAEEFVGQSFMVIASDLSANDDDWQGLLRTVIAHELTHAVEAAYDGNDWHDWYYEATASWMESAVYPLHESNLESAVTALNYPEICFGSSDVREGIGLDYGTWLFMQSLVDQYDETIIRQLWESIEIHEGFDGLIQMLATYNQSLQEIVLRYHAQRLVRDITYMDQLDTTVKISQEINENGVYQSAGEGVQELGVNYIHFDAPVDTYRITIDSDQLDLYAVGIQDDEADVFALHQDGVIDASTYDALFLLVFNPKPAEDLDACRYSTYELDINSSTDTPASSAYQLNASHFLIPD